ncbi:MAG: ATP-binding cassette domain-containing protein [Coleofasciculaceae cyanobacterium SM2_1_6]|nr:ATP-binding cassette domain-containing protein [Coleofasciculaceae cyanobacterium SM2_1_6]
MAQVSIENLCKVFPARNVQNPKSAQKSGQGSTVSTVLEDINLTIGDGEFMVLVGPSGCGKSTLLRTIAGLETSTSGTIIVDNQVVNALPPKARNMAMVFQSYALYPHLTVYENIAFGLRRTQDGLEVSKFPLWLENLLVETSRHFPKPLRYTSLREQSISQKVGQVAQLLQMENLLSRLPKQLSGGQRQRVALGRAIARSPQVFLMDEPLSNLDAKLRTETRTQIVKLQRQLKTTTIYVTHDQIEAMTMGDRIAVMQGGKIQQIATPLELYHYPANQFVAEFIGSPTMNFLPLRVETSQLLVHPQFPLELPQQWGEALKSYQGRSITLGIRPEHLSIGESEAGNFPVTVDLVESLGNDTYVFVNLDNTHNLQIRLTSDHAATVGDQLWLAIDLEKIHLFAPDSGERIIPAARSTT